MRECRKWSQAIPANQRMISRQMTDLGCLMRGEIIWDKNASAGISCAWGSWKSASNSSARYHEYILVFSKDRYDRPSKDKTSTITGDEFIEYTKSVWTFQTESAKRVKHPAPYPVSCHVDSFSCIHMRMILFLTHMGSGTTALASVESGRYYVGYETSSEYVETAKQRLKNQDIFMRQTNLNL